MGDTKLAVRAWGALLCAKCAMIGARRPYTFDYAISFSAECRSVAKELAEHLTAFGAVVFYDEFYRSYLLGKRLDHEFAWLFGGGTRFFVPIVSALYAERTWPQHEWSVARREAENRQEEFILPIRVDDSLLHVLPDAVGYMDLRRHPVNKVAELLIEKIGDSTVTMYRTHKEQMWVAAFGLLIQDLLDSEDLPPEAPSGYANLCDWLTEDLEGRLARTSLGDPRLTEDARNGETFSLRVGFEWDPSKGPLEFGELGWWELLELLPYDQIYDSASTVEGGN